MTDTNDTLQQDISFQSVDELVAFLRQEAQVMPKRLRECANYILEARERIAVSTVADIATAAGVQPSAVIRLCKFCGMSGFSELQRLYRREHAATWPDYATRLAQMQLAGPVTSQRLLADFVEAGRTSLAAVFNTVDMVEFERAISLVSNAKLVHVVGFRRAFPVASYLTYTLEQMGIPTVLHAGVGRMDQTCSIRKGDVVLAVTYAPYSEETTAVIKQAHLAKVPVVSITDLTAPSSTDPGDVALTVREEDVGAFRGLSASLTLASALAVSAGQHREL